MDISPIKVAMAATAAGTAVTLGTKFAVGEGGDVGALTTRQVDGAVGWGGAVVGLFGLLGDSPYVFAAGIALSGAALVSAGVGGTIKSS